MISIIREIQRQNGPHGEAHSQRRRDRVPQQHIRPVSSTQEGIELNASPPATQQLNGHAERTVRRSRTGGARCMHPRGRAGLDVARCYQTCSLAVESHARLRHHRRHTVRAASGQSAEPRAESMVGVWGCDCYVHHAQGAASRTRWLLRQSLASISATDETDNAADGAAATHQQACVITRDVRFPRRQLRATCAPEAPAKRS